MNKLININIETATKEDINNEIERLEYLKKYFQNLEKGLKKILVSSYGVFGSKYFLFKNKNIAEAITLQSQHLIKFSKKIIEYYFKNLWHKDKKLHEKLNLTNVKAVNENIIIGGVTDSLFITFEPILKSCNFEGNELDLILKIYNYRLKNYIKNKLIKYSNFFNTKNFYDFKLKFISDNSLFFSKNHYIFSIVWINNNTDEGLKFKSLEKIKFLGIEIIHKDYPVWAKEKMQDLIKYILNKNKNLDINELIKKIKILKKEFKLQKIEDISFNIKVNNYEKYVIHNKNEIILNKNTPIHIKAAAIYNKILKENNLLNKYSLINNNTKIKYYYTNDDYEVFAFCENNYPIEFALNFNYEKMFDKIIISPINKFLKILNKPEINNNLLLFKTIF